MCVFKNHAFIYFLRPPSWSGTIPIFYSCIGCSFLEHRFSYPGLITKIKYRFFSYIFLEIFVYTEYLCRPSEASTRYCVTPGDYPPQDWQSLLCAGEELDLNPGLLICSQVHYHWATSPPQKNLDMFKAFYNRTSKFQRQSLHRFTWELEQDLRLAGKWTTFFHSPDGHSHRPVAKKIS